MAIIFTFKPKCTDSNVFSEIALNFFSIQIRMNISFESLIVLPLFLKTLLVVLNASHRALAASSRSPLTDRAHHHHS